MVKNKSVEKSEREYFHKQIWNAHINVSKLDVFKFKLRVCTYLQYLRMEKNKLHIKVVVNKLRFLKENDGDNV